MTCSASFTVRWQNGTFSYNALSCQDALQILKDLSSESKTFTLENAQIETTAFFLRKSRQDFPVASPRQFACFLNCAMNFGPSDLQACNNTCEVFSKIRAKSPN